MENETGILVQLFQYFGAIGGIAGVAAIIVALSGRRKAKAEAVDIIQEAAGNIVEQYRSHNKDLISECVGLKSDLEILRGRMDENETCQTTLKRQIADLETEKRDLQNKVFELTSRIVELEKENRRLLEARAE